MSAGASALSVLQYQGQPYISVSDLIGALAHMMDSLAEDSEQRKPLAMLRDMFEGMLGPVEQPQKVEAHHCPGCSQPVVTLEALGQDDPVTVEVFSSADGAWVPVDRQDGSVLLVPWAPRLDGAGARVGTHVCPAAEVKP